MPSISRDSYHPPSSTPLVTAPAVPAYLEQHYWWAYVHPRAVSIFEREWLVNLILFGNYGRLRDTALTALACPAAGSILQVACVYGNLTSTLMAQMSATTTLDVVDILPVQLHNLSHKIPSDPRVSLVQGDSAALNYADASHDRALLFFLLHEQPEGTRRATLRETLRVVKPGGRVVIVDYHPPRAWHPLRPLMKRVFARLEPFAHDLWEHTIHDYLPVDIPVKTVEHTTLFGGLYQLLVLER